MKKVIIGLSVALLAFGAMGCSKEKKTRTAAGPSADELQQVEAKYQRHDDNGAAGSDLTCKYVVVQGANGSYTISKSEVKTTGSCDWNSLASKATTAGALSAQQAAQIAASIATGGLPPSAKEKWDCTAINVFTSNRKAGLQDCKDKKGAGQNVASTIANILGL